MRINWLTTTFLDHGLKNIVLTFKKIIKFFEKNHDKKLVDLSWFFGLMV